MSEAPTTSIDGLVRLGPGRLVLVVGPSGAGKDTLLNLARAACAGGNRIVFPRRVVTRQASAFEDNEEMDEPAFRRALTQGRFAIHWEAHGHCYGVPRAIDDDIRAGRTVVVNVSRTVIAAVRGLYAHVLVVAITAPPQVLADRLAKRNRGSDGDIGERLHRTVEEEAPVADATIVNVGDPKEHAQVLMRLVTGEHSADEKAAADKRE
jgi:ribose 1,5-bisphosphokinase